MAFDLPGWMAGSWEPRRHGPARALVRSDFVPWFDRHELIRAAAPGPDPGPLAAADSVRGGRGPARVIPAGSLGEAVVRRYRRGGLVRHLVRDRYFLGHRAFRELVVTATLRHRGAPVPEPLAAIRHARRPGYSACFVTRRIPAARPAAEALAEAAPREVPRMLEEVGRAVRALHDRGGHHADLNAHNLLVPGPFAGPVVILDFDRGRVTAGPLPARLRRRALRRLRRSLRKLGLEQALGAWAALERGYDAEPDPEPAA